MNKNKDEDKEISMKDIIYCPHCVLRMKFIPCSPYLMTENDIMMYKCPECKSVFEVK